MCEGVTTNVLQSCSKALHAFLMQAHGSLTDVVSGHYQQHHGYKIIVAAASLVALCN